MIRRLFIPDCHFPDVDERAFNAMLDMAVDFKPHEVVILGDFFDVYCLSRFDKDPHKIVRDLNEELATGIEALAKISKLLKPQKMIFLEGNHENRITRYLHKNAPYVSRLIPPIRELLCLGKNCNYVPYGQFAVLDGLTVCHGIATGKNCCNKMLDLLGTDILFGHTHRLQMSTKRLYEGRIIKSFSAGWLGSFHNAAEYMHFADWAHGFATQLVSKSGRWSAQLHSIENGVCVY